MFNIFSALLLLVEVMGAAPLFIQLLEHQAV
jgi:hypothetical protein